jgi:glyoxylase-like metal-dependent hydrolase (beta-lactamase superfamily II)
MAGLELEPLAGRTHLIRGPVNVGVYALDDRKAVLIDAGNDDDGGRKLLRCCEAAGLTVVHIVNTHSNADHCGGNAFIQARTRCRISATRTEAAFIESPSLEPSYLWGGFPLAPLRSKFLMAKPSSVTDLLVPPCSVPGTELEAVPLPGHFLAMVGLRTPDRVFFAADTVASAEILSKYHVFFYYDLAAQLETLEALTRIEADWIVPSHAAPTRDIRPLVELNRAKIFEIAAVLLETCAEPSTQETLLARLADHYGIELNPAQYVLLGSTLRSYLAWMLDRQEVTMHFEGNRLLFSRV